MADKKNSDRQEKGDGFEKILERLEETLEKLERGNLPLEQSIELYTKGVEMLKSARGVLDKAQSRLEVLMSSDEDGEPKARELDRDEFLEDE